MNDCGISKLDLKRRNRMQILKVVREQGPISRVDISAILGITRAAVTIITNEMIDQHILEEVGEEPVNPSGEVRKGRRKILLDINETCSGHLRGRKGSLHRSDYLKCGSAG